MQKLIFRNGNGKEINLTSGDYGITEWEGFSANELNIQSQQVAFQDGGVFLDALLEQRILSVTVAMNAKNDLEKRYRLRREMISTLNPKLGEGLLIYTNDFLSKQIHVIPQLPVFENNNSNDSGTPKVGCSFVACNPYWEDIEETEKFYSKYSTGEILYEGDVKSNLEIEIIPEYGENIAVEKCSIHDNNLELVSDDYVNSVVKINCNEGKKSVSKCKLESFYKYVGVKAIEYFNGSYYCISTNGFYKYDFENNIFYRIPLYSELYPGTEATSFSTLKLIDDALYIGTYGIPEIFRMNLEGEISLIYESTSIMYVQGIEKVGDYLVAVGDSLRQIVRTSLDNIQWETVSGLGTRVINSIASDGEKLYIMDNSGVLTITDFTTTTTESIGDNNSYVAVSDDTILVSLPTSDYFRKKTESQWTTGADSTIGNTRGSKYIKGYGFIVWGTQGRLYWTNGTNYRQGTYNKFSDWRTTETYNVNVCNGQYFVSASSHFFVSNNPLTVQQDLTGVQNINSLTKQNGVIYLSTTNDVYKVESEYNVKKLTNVQATGKSMRLFSTTEGLLMLPNTVNANGKIYLLRSEEECIELDLGYTGIMRKYCYDSDRGIHYIVGDNHQVYSGKKLTGMIKDTYFNSVVSDFKDCLYVKDFVFVCGTDSRFFYKDGEANWKHIFPFPITPDDVIYVQLTYNKSTDAVNVITNGGVLLFININEIRNRTAVWGIVELNISNPGDLNYVELFNLLFVSTRHVINSELQHFTIESQGNFLYQDEDNIYFKAAYGTLYIMGIRSEENIVNNLISNSSLSLGVRPDSENIFSYIDKNGKSLIKLKYRQKYLGV